LRAPPQRFPPRRPTTTPWPGAPPEPARCASEQAPAAQPAAHPSSPKPQPQPPSHPHCDRLLFKRHTTRWRSPAALPPPTVLPALPPLPPLVEARTVPRLSKVMARCRASSLQLRRHVALAQLMPSGTTTGRWERPSWGRPPHHGGPSHRVRPTPACSASRWSPRARRWRSESGPAHPLPDPPAARGNSATCGRCGSA